MKTRIFKSVSASFWSAFIVMAILLTGYATQASAVTPQLSAGNSHTVALRNDGTVWAWGYNDYGQLGINPGWSPLQALISLGAQQYTVTLNAGSNGSISGPTTVNAGDMPTYTITATPGYHVVDVTVGGVSVGAVISYTFPTGINADVTIMASFAIDTYSLTVTLDEGTPLPEPPPAHQALSPISSTAAVPSPAVRW